jgi:hypothetical protein
MTSWHPITTAPRDGQTVLAYLPAKAGLTTRQDVVAIFWAVGSGWATAYSGAHLDAEPTYWMPLPEAPSRAEHSETRRATSRTGGHQRRPAPDAAPVVANP